MRETPTHIYFWSGYLSNWDKMNPNFPIILKHNVYIDDDITRVFWNSEQLFMWYKAKYFKDNDIARDILLKGENPKIAKELGREIKNFSNEEWDKVKEDFMFLAVKEKFLADGLMRRKLMNTQPKILVEGSPTDSVWGVGLHYSDDKILDESNWQGQNLLGKALNP
jgi:ribA/ribD-fused uncharacterized protein